MKQPTHKVKYTLAVLLLAALTTTQILSAVYAKYTVNSGLVLDSARVAVYDVTIVGVDMNKDAFSNNTVNTTLNSGDINLDAAGDKNISNGTITDNRASVTKAYKIVNKSETAVSYNIVVELTKELPTGTTMILKDNTGSTIEPQKEGNVFTFTSSSFAFAPNANESGAHTIQLTFTTDNTNASAVTDLSGIGVTVTVNAVQID